MLSRKNRGSLIFVVWMVIGISWIWFRAPCGTHYHADYAEVVNYADILSQYQSMPLGFALLVLLLPIVVTFVVALLLLPNVQHIWLGLFLPLPLFCGCLWFVAAAAKECDGGTLLCHVSTVEFDGSIYHLTFGRDYEDVLYLFCCDADGENCHGREILRETPGYLEQQPITIDAALNRLQVTAGSEVVFVLDSDNAPLSAPD
ncbi:MAG: hypothetical protein K8I30_09410 [Anaerolineae bacterium]|nr:hypothetical protein [Anaerolineae bacterium]